MVEKIEDRKIELEAIQEGHKYNLVFTGPKGFAIRARCVRVAPGQLGFVIPQLGEVERHIPTSLFENGLIEAHGFRSRTAQPLIQTQ